MTLATFFFYRNPSPQQASQNRTPTGHWIELLKNPTLLATSWSFFGFGVILYFGLTWIPGYFEQTFGEKLSTRFLGGIATASKSSTHGWQRTLSGRACHTT